MVPKRLKTLNMAKIDEDFPQMLKSCFEFFRKDDPVNEEQATLNNFPAISEQAGLVAQRQPDLSQDLSFHQDSSTQVTPALPTQKGSARSEIQMAELVIEFSESGQEHSQGQKLGQKSAGKSPLKSRPSSSPKSVAYGKTKKRYDGTRCGICHFPANKRHWISHLTKEAELFTCGYCNKSCPNIKIHFTQFHAGRPKWNFFVNTAVYRDFITEKQSQCYGKAKELMPVKRKVPFQQALPTQFLDIVRKITGGKLSHVEKRIVCNVCSANFSQCCSSVRDHTYRHVGEPLFACGICNFTSWNIQSLMKHLKSEHGEEMNQANAVDIRHVFDEELVDTVDRCFIKDRSEVSLELCSLSDPVPQSAISTTTGSMESTPETAEETRALCRMLLVPYVPQVVHAKSYSKSTVAFIDECAIKCNMNPFCKSFYYRRTGKCYLTYMEANCTSDQEMKPFASSELEIVWVMCFEC